MEVNIKDSFDGVVMLWKLGKDNKAKVEATHIRAPNLVSEGLQGDTVRRIASGGQGPTSRIVHT